MAVLRVVGYLLLFVGIVWAAWITGAVVSRTEGFTSLSGLWGGIAFHIVSMALGTYLAALGRYQAAQARKAA